MAYVIGKVGWDGQVTWLVGHRWSSVGEQAEVEYAQVGVGDLTRSYLWPVKCVFLELKCR